MNMSVRFKTTSVKKKVNGKKFKTGEYQFNLYFQYQMRIIECSD